MTLYVLYVTLQSHHSTLTDNHEVQWLRHTKQVHHSSWTRSHCHRMLLSNKTSISHKILSFSPRKIISKRSHELRYCNNKSRNAYEDLRNNENLLKSHYYRKRNDSRKKKRKRVNKMKCESRCFESRFRNDYKTKSESVN